MAGAPTEEGEQNYWPGFVDALSNMVMAMIFLVLIFTAILFAAMQNKAKTAAEKSEKMMAAAAKETSTLKAKLAQLQARVEGKTCAPGETLPLSATPASLLTPSQMIPTAGHYRPSEIGKAETAPQVKGAGALITIEYRSDSYALDKDARARLDAALNTDGVSAATTKVEIVAEQATAAGGASDAQRAAFFRALAIRNQLIAHGWRAADVSVRMPYREQGAGPPHATVRIYPRGEVRDGGGP